MMKSFLLYMLYTYVYDDDDIKYKYKMGGLVVGVSIIYAFCSFHHLSAVVSKCHLLHFICIVVFEYRCVVTTLQCCVIVKLNKLFV